VKNTKEIGELGENIAARYLSSRRFKIVERNYRKKWGEIDLIAEKNSTLHFVEVKAVSRENFGNQKGKFSRGTGEYRPEENVHPKKLERLYRAIQSYLAEHKQEDAEWQLDVLAVEINRESKTARCRFLENVI